MQSFHLDLAQDSRWLCATPGAAMQQLGFYCTEAGIFYGRSKFSTRRSSKSSYLLVYTFSGCGQLECDNTSVTVRPCTLLLLNCRVPHCYRTKPGDTQWNFYWAHIDGAGVAGYFSMLGAAPYCCCPPTEQQPALAEAWEQLLNHARQHTLAEGLSVSFQIHLILQAAAASLTGSQSASRTAAQAVEAAATYLRAHYAEPLSLGELARQTALSECYLIRLFRQQIGTTPYDYLLRYRLTKSKSLLAATELPVSEIAERSGFKSTSNYTAQFSRLCGMTPLQYRQSTPGAPPPNTPRQNALLPPERG